jgi:hypothetical protein
MNYYSLLLEEVQTGVCTTQTYASHSTDTKIVHITAQMLLERDIVHHVLPLYTQINNN